MAFAVFKKKKDRKDVIAYCISKRRFVMFCITLCVPTSDSFSTSQTA